ncbi:MbcA/ParS/Xre antitoxin family protein [Arsukibacterium sp.]|uniref:MbcA/ParS/Xre antitoxin family protein n=1 Tax=Arsukibacterium sp. TaxID=1977258 RepID=UPI002FD8FDB2
MQALDVDIRQEKLGPVAIKMFMNIAGNEWLLSEKDMRVLLGEPSRSTFYNWRSGKVSALSRDTLERVSFIAGIYKALHLLFVQPEQANTWIKKPNTAFGGRSALEVMLAGSLLDLARVRQYLDAQRG